MPSTRFRRIVPDSGDAYKVQLTRRPKGIGERAGSFELTGEGHPGLKKVIVNIPNSLV
jgi:hypothetical protein